MGPRWYYYDGCWHSHHWAGLLLPGFSNLNTEETQEFNVWFEKELPKHSGLCQRHCAQLLLHVKDQKVADFLYLPWTWDSQCWSVLYQSLSTFWDPPQTSGCCQDAVTTPLLPTPSTTSVFAHRATVHEEWSLLCMSTDYTKWRALILTTYNTLTSAPSHS